MILRGRTILQCIIVIQICLQYSLIYEAVTFMGGPVHFTIFDFNYPYLFAVLLTVVLVLTIVLNIILFLYGMIGHTRKKKDFVIGLFGFHCIVVIPFFISGGYLYVLASSYGASAIGSQQSTEFHTAHNSTMKIFKNVMAIQERFCCCGFYSAADWGNNSTQQEGLDSSSLLHNEVVSCPNHVNTGCREQTFEGCATKIPRIGRTFIANKHDYFHVCTVVGMCCGIVAMIISPCVYASFEYDRRFARARHIRGWRRNLMRKFQDERRHYKNHEDAALNETEKNEGLPEPSVKETQLSADRLHSGGEVVEELTPLNTMDANNEEVDISKRPSSSMKDYVKTENLYLLGD